ncbi:hypothetical protein [Shewanella halifaxensis]|uniref:hypothetical protein n=1 Tax=Shewanella halifaxensis TaxID=271098 RepID=UPI00059DA31A|nr:hypothetical protein [Shewanella halifaxensis]
MMQDYQFSRQLSGIFDSHMPSEVAKEKMAEWVDRVMVLKRRCYGLSDPTKLFQRLLVDTTGMIQFALGAATF